MLMNKPKDTIKKMILKNASHFDTDIIADSGQSIWLLRRTNPKYGSSGAPNIHIAATQANSYIVVVNNN
jgi:hypothetical protein